MADRAPTTARRTAWFARIALLLGLVGFALLLLPVEWLYPPRELALDRGTLRPESGHAWLLAAPAGAGPSDASGGHSELLLLEDGLPLSPHAIHDEIRSAGGGRFSHWGELIYFASSDGSDPSRNGRSYTAQLPRRPDPVHARLALTLLVAAAVLALGAAWKSGRAARLAAGALIGCTAALLLGLLPAWRWELRLERLARSFATPGSPAASALVSAPEPPRTQRLFSDTVWPRFVPTGPVPPAAQPVVLDLQLPASAVRADDGWIRLAPEEALRSGPLDLAAESLGSVELDVAVQGADLLRLVFELEWNPERAARRLPGADPAEWPVEIPIAPGPEARRVRLLRPLALEGAGHRVIGLRVGPPVASTGSFRLRVERLAFVAPLAELGAAAAGRAPVERDNDLRPAFWQRAVGRFEVDWPEGAGRCVKVDVLRLDVAEESRWEPVHWELAWSGADGARGVLAQGAVSAESGWQAVRVELPEQEIPQRLELSVYTLPPGAAFAWSGLRAVDTTRPARRVLLVLADTLRADALGAHGAPGNPTPRLDALAAEGVRFARCMTQGHWTRPAMPALFAGRYPTATGVQTVGQRLPLEFPTLAERMFAQGFHTVAFVTNTNAGPNAGLERGFESMSMDFTSDQSGTAEYLQSRVEPRLSELLDEDLFCYVHLMEAHGPYGPREPPPEWLPPSHGTPVDFDPTLDRAWLFAPTREARRQLYDLDVRALDTGLGELLQRWLPRWERQDAPVIVALVSDHGEYLGEHGAWGHGWHPILPEVMHVPFLLRAPGRLPAGAVVHDVVSLIDVGATLLELVDAPLPERAVDVGRSLVTQVLTGKGPPNAVALASAELYGSQLFSVVAHDGSLVGQDGRLVTAVDGDGLAGAVRSQAERLLHLLHGTVDGFEQAWQHYLDSQRAVAATRGTAEDASFDPQMLEQLQALGYLGAER